MKEYDAICPTCGGTGKPITKSTPINADIGWNDPGTNASWFFCPVCGNTGRHVVLYQSAEAATRSGALKATIGTMDDAIARAAKLFNEGQRARQRTDFSDQQIKSVAEIVEGVSA